MVLTPPFQAPDEDSHFKKAMYYQKEIYSRCAGWESGIYAAKGNVRYITMQNNKGGNLDEKFNYKDMYLTERLPGEYGEQKFDGFSTAKTNPVGHIVQATGIVLAM